MPIIKCGLKVYKRSMKYYKRLHKVLDDTKTIFYKEGPQLDTDVNEDILKLLAESILSVNYKVRYNKITLNKSCLDVFRDKIIEYFNNFP